MAVLLGVLATFLVYRPDRDLPFDFLDFSEFLPLLQNGDSFFDRVRNLVSYYSGQGRLNLIAYSGIAAKWELFGDNVRAWQWTRFATMWIGLVLAFVLLRRIGVARRSAIAATALLAFAPPAVDGWIRLTTTEPLGLVLLLIATLVSLRPSRPENERRTGFFLAALFAVIILLKEMLAATLMLPPLLIFATRLDRVTGRRRLRTVLAAMSLSIFLAAIPIVATAIRAPNQAYSSAFGSQVRSLTDAIAYWSVSILPFDPGATFPPELTGLALLAFISIVVYGWKRQLSQPNVVFDARFLLASALFFPLIGALIYLPWPAWSRFYAFPFLMGGVVLAAVALSAIEQSSRRGLILSNLVWAILIGGAAADASSLANRMAARQMVNLAVVNRLSEYSYSHDTVIVATDQRVPADWQGIGPTLERYGKALGLRMPTLVNMRCDDSRARLATRETALMAYGSHCAGFLNENPIMYRYRRLRFPSMLLSPDSLRVDFFLPKADRGLRTTKAPAQDSRRYVP